MTFLDLNEAGVSPLMQLRAAWTSWLAASRRSSNDVSIAWFLMEDAVNVVDG